MLDAVSRLWPRWPNSPVLRNSAQPITPLTSFETFVKKIATLNLEPRILELMHTPAAELKTRRLATLGLSSDEQRLAFADKVEAAFGIRFGPATRESIQRNCSLEHVYKRTRVFYRTQRAA